MDNVTTSTRSLGSFYCYCNNKISRKEKPGATFKMKTKNFLTNEN